MQTCYQYQRPNPAVREDQMAVASQRGRSTLPNHFPAPLTSYSTYIHVTHMQRAFRLNYASVNSGHVRLSLPRAGDSIMHRVVQGF